MHRRFARRLRLRARLVAATLTVLALAGCTTGPSVRPAVIDNDGRTAPASPSNAAPVPLPALTPPQGSSLRWADCGEDTRERIGTPGVPASLQFGCARMTVPLDAPEDAQRLLARVYLLKVGTGPIPLVVVNDVGGEPGSVHAARLAAQLPPAFLEKFSLIGVDRRGTGLSGGVQCAPEEVRPALLGADPAQGGLGSVLDAARRVGQQCAIDLDTAQTALDSWRTAGDLEQLRRALGSDRLNALGRGDGSKVLSEYAVRYPGQVGRMVLDGLPDPGADRGAVLDAVAGGAQAAFDAFAADCAARGCALGDAKAALKTVTDRLRTAPATTPGGVAMSAGIATYAVYLGLADRTRWPALADALTAARDGDLTALATFTDPVLIDTRDRASRISSTIATRCNDSSTRLPADQIDRTEAGLRGKYPQFGAAVAQELAWCGAWPVRREPLPAAGAPGAPPILVAATAADPVTPQLGTTRAADQMPSAVTVTWQGAGHGAVGPSTCVTTAVQSFLIDGKVPESGTLCPA
ncbi:alpha/beta fold hydrolase [Amycolatopsis jiangsuensis]|uniref:Pimeloyl-ACP methyl ester carboxylesterase n=1 Tax=Amycolatopsis jiangsuensis TaxID=1181879 RepID=A0A840IU86_9PSEU|nr:alpha/beta hydrolase [Amycolatopsis jiangsuensis]MBB4684718.1 pimeloyl-ACP methyl ester carboxylesterase [Amycolatopsis jiangsuensis]